MSKKFSTLVAVLLAAGTWTTLDAKVVKVESPVAGSSYLVGTGINTDKNTEFTLLLGTDGISEQKSTGEVTAKTETFTLVATDKEGIYQLQTADGKVFYATNTAEGGTDLSLAGKAGENQLAVKFSISGGKLVLANDDDFATNNAISSGMALKLEASNASLNEEGSTIDFGIYASDAKGVIPGFDLTVDDDGKLVETDKSSSYDTPVYFQNADGKYLAVELKDGSYVIKELDEVTPSNALSASWLWQKGKLYSVLADQNDKTILLAYDKGEQKYSVVTNSAQAASLDLKAGQSLEGAKTGASLSASAVLAAGEAEIEMTISTEENVVGSQLEFLKAAPGANDYVVVVLSDGSTTNYLKAGVSNSVSSSFSVSDTESYANYLWKVTPKLVNKVLYYTFESLATDGNDKHYVWTISNETDFVANAEYGENGITLTANNSLISAKGTTSGNAAVISLFKAFDLAKTKDQLDQILNPGFDLTVKYEKDDSKKVFENADAFAGTMFPEAATKDNTIVELWDEKEDDRDTKSKQLVLEVEEISGSDVKGDFKWLTEKEITKNEGDGKTYYKGFRFEYVYNGTDEILRVAVFEDKDATTVKGYISILENNGKYYLTTSKDIDAKKPYIKLGGDNIKPVTELLGKLWNITYTDSRANANEDDEAYKLNGILSVLEENNGDSEDVEANYVAESSVVENAPEAQWMVTKANLKDNTFTLTNRENPTVTISDLQLRKRDGGKYELYVMKAFSSMDDNQKNLIGGANKWGEGANDIIYLNKSTKANNFEGYAKYTEYDLRSNNFHLGQYHGVSENNNAYFVENHDNSHQIGAVANAEDADKWKLHFAMKENEDTEKYSDVDTVYIVTEYATLNADGDGFLPAGDKDVKKDTLAILPYTFQKVMNQEFVRFDGRTNFDFYICDEDNKDNSVAVGNKDPYTRAQRFALKVKPNGYNFVEIVETGDEEECESYVTDYKPNVYKAFLANSENGGSLERMDAYAKDNNSIMVVEAADASEYHKVAGHGGIVKLFRDENNDQVLYEKHDAKSVVDGETLSFLNIDDTNQFDVNPAIFVDTAYVDRYDSEGVLNTTYQYLLAVNDEMKETFYCPYNDLHNDDTWREEHGVCADVKGHKALKGRFLVNLIDTANVYGVNHIHTNWYINEAEVGADKHAKLSFVEGTHAGDTLYLTRKDGETVKIAMDSPEFNVAKFAFRYVDSENKTFKIQTLWKKYLGDNSNLETAEEFAEEYEDDATLTSNEGYLRWINGTVVVTKGYENGDVFGIEEGYEGDATANESIEAASTISVSATNGAVIVKGAEGKNVVITNVLGQTIASTVIASSEATIAVPAGVVFVAVEGEAAVKAIVK
ncbi:MAG: DUF6383 domain-containing protein [Parabacteroides sp.]|nr:DUF6383 domain-containing protein [Parabacteroides sp.]